MTKTSVAFALAIAFATATAHADVGSYRLTYQGFDVDGTYRADKVFEVAFSANDTNGDGTYTLDELLTFSGNGFTYPGYCDDGSNRSCVTAFSFTHGGPIAFAASSFYTDNVATSAGRDVVAGQYYDWYWHSPTITQGEHWQWTAQTALTITDLNAPPVPEPATYALLGAGLAVLGAARRRSLGVRLGVRAR